MDAVDCFRYRRYPRLRQLEVHSTPNSRMHGRRKGIETAIDAVAAVQQFLRHGGVGLVKHRREWRPEPFLGTAAPAIPAGE